MLCKYEKGMEVMSIEDEEKFSKKWKGKWSRKLLEKDCKTPSNISHTDCEWILKRFSNLSDI